MQRELLWFKEVEKIIQPLFKEIKDSEGRTPQMLFTEEHKGLAKGEKWLKNTASSCMLVATLLSFSLFPTPQPFSLPLSHLSIASHPLLFSLVSLRPPNLLRIFFLHKGIIIRRRIMVLYFVTFQFFVNKFKKLFSNK
ncbi:hypothetical protein JHK86_042520 [Glycine max]|nr:hypothetical protein JHK86_042520 [Glycine max]